MNTFEDSMDTAFGKAETLRLQFQTDNHGLTWDEFVLLETMTLSPKDQRKVIDWCRNPQLLDDIDTIANTLGGDGNDNESQ